MKLFIFARFHAQPGREAEVEEALRDLLKQARRDEGCLGIHAFQDIQDERLYLMHSRWRDEPAFERYVARAHVVRFIEKVEKLVDRPVDITRAILAD